MRMFDSSDPWSSVIILLTFVLFGLALFAHGFTHNVLLESAVFLVSLKLILMARRNTENTRRLERHMDKLEELLTQREGSRDLEQH